jgi:hypothetical protein
MKQIDVYQRLLEALSKIKDKHSGTERYITLEYYIHKLVDDLKKDINRGNKNE